ncbi:MAG: RNA polymerase sigma factor [Planctomycetota bacterium]|jgi:RNA polymerase sigma-70 factor (ECF subfamily)
MTHDSTHPSLLSRVRDPANRAAWREFESRYGPLVLGYCRSLGLQLADAEDVRQDVMMSLSSALGAFRYDRSRGRFRSYLGRAVRNAVVRHGKRHERTARALDTGVLDMLARADDEQDVRWDEQWLRHHCRLALDSLRESQDPRHVEVFEALLNGLGIAAIAETTGMTNEAVRKIKQRMRDRLRDIVARQLHDEDPTDDG